MPDVAEKGQRECHTEQAARVPALRTSSCVVLRAGVCAVLVCLSFVSVDLAAPAGASAGFTREFARQILGTCPAPGTCGSAEVIPFGDFGPMGLATDETGSIWVGYKVNSTEVTPIALSQFDSAEQGNLFRRTFEPTSPEPPPVQEHAAPESLAINQRTGTFYLTGQHPVGPSGGKYLDVFDKEGGFLNRAGPFSSAAAVAVDNSTDPLNPSACGTFPLSPSECYVYLVHNDVGAPSGNGQRLGIEKLNARGEPVPFSAAVPYVEGNEIVGTPPPTAGGCEGEADHFVAPGTLGAITVDSAGDIFVVESFCNLGLSAEHVVLEYGPSGEFVRKITGAETRGIAGRTEGNEGPFGGQLTGLGFDPASDHLLVAVSNNAGPRHAGAVDEFDASSGTYITQFTETSPGSPLASPSQITVDSHGNLYVSEQQQQVVDVWGPGHLPPGLRLAEPTERRSTSVVLNSSVNSGGLGLTDCRFQWVSAAVFKSSGFEDLSSGGEAPCVPAAGGIPTDSAWHAVHAEATPLVSGTTYRYRLLAATAGALGGPAASVPLAFTAPHPPRIDSTSAGNLSSAFADLHALIEPLGADTTYHFEYDTTPYTPGGEGHGVSVPIPGASIGAGGPDGSTGVSVLQKIGGLQPATTYHFRVVATNEVDGNVETTDGPDTTFTTLSAPVPGLPDNRAYELLTPPDKGSAVDMFNAPHEVGGEFVDGERGAPADFGDGFVLETQSAFAPFSAAFTNAYVFSRTAGAWRYTDLASPSLGVQSINAGGRGQGPLFEPGELSSVAFVDQVGSLAGEEGSREEVLAGPPGGPYALLHADLPVHAEEADLEETRVAGASRDLSHIILQSKNHQLAPGDSGQDLGTRALYEWSGGGECILEAVNCKLLNFDSKGKLLRCGAELGGGSGESIASQGEARNAVSPDGSRLFFTAPDPRAQRAGPGCWNGASENPPQLYMRYAGTTVEISKPPAGVKERPVRYIGASEGGSKAFFLTETEYEAGINDMELYEYDTETETLMRISTGTGSPEANVFGVTAVAADGSAIYFEAFGRLTGDAPASLPERQVYLYRYGLNAKSEPETTYITTVFTDEATNPGLGWFPLKSAGPVPAADWYTTPDGRYLLFATSQSLTGYGTAGPCPKPPETQGPPNGRCEELYRFDASEPVAAGVPGVADNPVCVSCNPSGAPPVSHARFTRSDFTAGTAGAVRAMSNDGRYVFFDTADSLVPKDTNGTLDVYEWEALDTGGCALARGCVHLISSGKDPSPSFFLGATQDGANVFFGTHAHLVSQDTDTAGDLYDARVCTAVDACIQPQAGGTALCEGDACQASAPTPIYAPPATEMAAGSASTGSPGTSPPASKVSVATRTATGSAFSIRVNVSSAGAITVSGSLIKAAKRAVRDAGVYSLSVSLKPTARVVLRRKHVIKVKLRVTLSPATGKPAEINATVKVRA
jgi:hypothetical protein